MKEGFEPSMMAEEPAAEMIRETYDVLRGAMDAGVADSVMPPAMVRKLDDSLFLFSGFKTAQELKEASSLLRKADGSVKAFTEFYTDVRRIDTNYNVNYLEAEYNFAISSSQMAASWAEVQEGGDRYDLQYRTAGDSHVREEHRALNGITLPPDDPFWQKYYPPNGWNCRCTVRQVRKGKFRTSDPDEAMRRGDEATDSPKQKIFRFNPGIDRQLFPPHHPYYKLSQEAQEEIKKAVNEVREEATDRQQRIDAMIAELPDNLTPQEKTAIAEHNLEMEKSLGITKGKPMTVEEADKQNANPRFGENRGYGINCQTCAPAYLLRSRGFDITAKPNTSGSLLDYLSRGTNAYEVWRNTDNTPAQYTSIINWMTEKGYKKMTPKRYLEFFDETCREVGIYELSIGWRRGGGHATILQRFPDGELRYIEPQYDNSKGSGREYADLNYLAQLGSANPHKCRGILRIDNKLFNLDFIGIFDK